MDKIDKSLLTELDDQRSATAPGLLTNAEKDRHIERAFVGLYRWYVSRSQQTRNWNPNTDIDWRNYRTDHSDKLNQIIEGFFAVEQYVPDYVLTLLQVIRRSYGRSHFHIRWGAEEEKHSDLWENALLFSRFRTPEWIEDYKEMLRSRQWELPWDSPLHMIFYTVIQERATQVNYLNTGLIARGKVDNPDFANDVDPVLTKASQIIAIDEAAHYNFFLEGARLFLYYYPAQSLEALQDVIQYFAMPAGNLIPNYDRFAEIVAKAGIYGPREHLSSVLDIALENLGVKGRVALRKGIQRIRQAPQEDGTMRDTAIFDLLDYRGVEDKVRRLFDRIGEYEELVGFNEIYPTKFLNSGLMPDSSAG
ncbi:MAG: acyl-ACP desaturase [Caldilineaceae bacterium]|nr:acyl-ACP desaturase [Caldilineaceae bacterium]